MTTGLRWPKGVARTLVWLALAFTAGCRDPMAPTPIALPSPGLPLVVLDAVTARQVGGDYAPIGITSQFSPSDTFYCAAKVADAERDTEIVARWYYGDALIDEMAYTTETSGTGYVAFELSGEQLWPKGLYRVEILSDGVVLHSVAFHVTK